MDFLNYCKQLQPEDWSKMVNEKWTVKDVVAHLAAWEKECARELGKAWTTREKPWFLKTDNWDDFNERSYNFYKDYSPEQLLDEWEKWQKELSKEIEKIGEGELKQDPDMFSWAFDVWATDEDNNPSHVDYHWKKVKKVLGK